MSVFLSSQRVDNMLSALITESGKGNALPQCLCSHTVQLMEEEQAFEFCCVTSGRFPSSALLSTRILDCFSLKRRGQSG